MIIRPCGVYVSPHRHNATLHTLKLERNEIGDVGAASIGEGLRCVHTDRATASWLLVRLARVWVCDGGPHRMGVHDHPTVWRV